MSGEGGGGLRKRSGEEVRERVRCEGVCVCVCCCVRERVVSQSDVNPDYQL